MLSVIDDSKTLELFNGDKLQIRSNVKFIFECDSIDGYSDAFLGRCAIVNVANNDSIWKALFLKKMRYVFESSYSQLNQNYEFNSNKEIYTLKQ